MKVLVGIDGAFEGHACVAGYDVRRSPMEVKQRVGYVPEVVALFQALTVREHLLLVGRMHGLPDDLTTARGKIVLDAFAMPERLNFRISSLSMGMRRKVMFAAALLHDPLILVLDEPLSGLDVQSTAVVKELVRALADAGRTVFFSSHLLDVVERVCDRVIVLQDGRIVADGTLSELSDPRRKTDTLEQLFLDLTNDRSAAPRARSIVEAITQGGP